MYFRKIIQIAGKDSPNVRLALAEIAAGKEPSHRNLVPGVLSYREYLRRDRMWDEIRKCIGLHGEFYKGAQTYMFPAAWLDLAERVGNALDLNRKPVGRVTLGLDSAQGGDNACWCVGDDLGVLRLLSRKTPDTSVIVPQTIALIDEYDIASEDICIDFGGGGKEHGDNLRDKGYKGVRIISFGSAPTDPNYYRRRKMIAERKDETETRMKYNKRRAELYGLVRNALNPVLNETVYGIPSAIMNKPREDGNVGLRGQLKEIPLWYNGDGQIYLPPKNKTNDPNKDEERQVSLTELIGCSPDEADAFCLMNYAREVRPTTFVVGQTGMRY